MGRYPMTRQEEGRLRQRVFKDGAYQDIVSMSMLPSEWLAGRAA